MPLSLSSEAFADGGEIPRDHTCDGAARSVPLSWSGVPQGTRSLCLICDDPDAPGGTFSHWAVYDIPAERVGLPAGLSAEAEADGLRQARNDFDKTGYGPPCPPEGHGTHRYVFRLYALDRAHLAVPEGAGVAAVEDAARKQALESAQITGLYARNG